MGEEAGPSSAWPNQATIWILIYSFLQWCKLCTWIMSPPSTLEINMLSSNNHKHCAVQAIFLKVYVYCIPNNMFSMEYSHFSFPSLVKSVCTTNIGQDYLDIQYLESELWSVGQGLWTERSNWRGSHCSCSGIFTILVFAGLRIRVEVTQIRLSIKTIYIYGCGEDCKEKPGPDLTLEKQPESDLI